MSENCALNHRIEQLTEEAGLQHLELEGKRQLLDKNPKFQELEDAVINMVKASVGGQTFDKAR